MLRAFGADDGGFGRFVDALVAFRVARVGPRVFVVELSQRDGVEVRRDGEDPGRWDGVQGLVRMLGVGDARGASVGEVLTKLRGMSRRLAAMFAVMS